VACSRVNFTCTLPFPVQLTLPETPHEQACDSTHISQVTSSYPEGTEGLSFVGYGDQDVKVTILFQLESRLEMTAPIPPLPHTSSARGPSLSVVLSL